MSEVTQADLRRRKQVHQLTSYVDMDMKLARILAAHRITADLAGYERGQRETVERIVAWLGDWIDQTMGADIGPAYLIKRIEAGEWK